MRVLPYLPALIAFLWSGSTVIVDGDLAPLWLVLFGVALAVMVWVLVRRYERDGWRER